MNPLNQSIQQLKALGYKKGDRVYIRLIAGKGYDIQADRLYPFGGYLTLGERGYSFTRLNPASKGGGEKFTAMDGHRYLTKENLRGYGVYLVVNPGGEKDENITECRSLFYECDDISKEEQYQRSERLPIQPSMVLDTRKSLHVYYRLDDTRVEGWRQLQQRLIQLMESDPAIVNESRLMRLAGFSHMKAGADPYPISIVSLTDSIHSRAEFDRLLPQWDDSQWSKAEKTSEADRIARLEAARARREANKEINPLESFPLEICLSKDDRDLIASGISEGGRNTNGVKLAKNLIGTESYLLAAGYRYDGDARSLFDEYSDRCNPPIADREREIIWRGAGRGNPSPSLSDDKIENCIKAYQRRNDFSFTSYQLEYEEYKAFVAKYEDEEAANKAYENYRKEREEENNKVSSHSYLYCHWKHIYRAFYHYLYFSEYGLR